MILTGCFDQATSEEQLNFIFKDIHNLPEWRGLKPGASTEIDVQSLIVSLSADQTDSLSQTPDHYIWEDKTLSLAEDIILQDGVVIYIGITPYSKISAYEILGYLGDPTHYSVTFNYGENPAIETLYFFENEGVALYSTTLVKDLDQELLDTCQYDLTSTEIQRFIMTQKENLVSTNIKGRFYPFDHKISKWKGDKVVGITNCP